jgi:hypothetical protein
MIQWLSIKLVNVCYDPPDTIPSVVGTILLHLLAGVIISGTAEEAKQSLPNQLRMLIFVVYWEIYVLIEAWSKADKSMRIMDWRRPRSAQQP